MELKKTGVSWSDEPQEENMNKNGKKEQDGGENR